MRILHINNYFAERFFYENLYVRQAKENNIAVAITVDKNFQQKHEYASYVKVIRCYDKIDKYLFFPRIRKSEKAVSEEIDIKDYDIIHAYSLFTNGSIARMISQKTGAPFIVTVRNVDVNTIFKKLFFLRPYGRRLLQSADQVIFLSESVKKLVKEKYCSDLPEDKCAIIPNGIDDFWIKNIAVTPKSRKDNRLRVLYAGDINKNKNLVHVAKTLNALKNKGKYEDISYEIIGDVYDTSVRDELGKFDFITILGRMKKEQLLEHYRNADIYIMASLHESFGLTYVEAMSQGTPVIYSMKQGFDGQFDEGFIGYHVDPLSKEELLEKIDLVVEHYERLSNNSLQSAKMFSWDKQAQLTSEVYEKAIRLH